MDQRLLTALRADRAGLSSAEARRRAARAAQRAGQIGRAYRLAGAEADATLRAAAAAEDRATLLPLVGASAHVLVASETAPDARPPYDCCSRPDAPEWRWTPVHDFCETGAAPVRAAILHGGAGGVGSGEALELDRLFSSSGLEELTLQGIQLTAAGLAGLERAAALSSLELGFGTEVHTELLAALAHAPSLRTLRLSGRRRVTDLGCEELGRVRALRELALGGAAWVTDVGVEALAGAERLERLALSGARWVTGSGLEPVVAACAGLRHVELTWCDRLTDEALLFLSDLPMLESLVLDVTPRLTAQGLRWLSLQPTLRRLVVARTERLDGSALEALHGAPRLRELELRALPLDARTLHALAALPLVRLSGSWVADEATDRALPRLGSLRELELDFQGAFDDGAARAIAQLPWLTRLVARGGGFTDAGLAALVELPRLEVLELPFAAISDAGLLALERAPSLRRVDLYGCAGVSAAGVARLRARLGEGVVRWHGTPSGSAG